jgi:prophage antirepressor-like protein
MKDNNQDMNAAGVNSLLNFNNFENGIHVRCVVLNDEPWFVAKDVCQALDIEKHRDAISTLHDDERGSVVVDTLGGKQTMGAVNESGLYALIFRSRKPAAQAFRKWVTSEVLPEIRRRGRYDPIAVAQQLPPLARRALLEHRLNELETEIVQVRKQV